MNKKQIAIVVVTVVLFILNSAIAYHPRIEKVSGYINLLIVIIGSILVYSARHKKNKN